MILFTKYILPTQLEAMTTTTTTTISRETGGRHQRVHNPEWESSSMVRTQAQLQILKQV